MENLVRSTYYTLSVTSIMRKPDFTYAQTNAQTIDTDIDIEVKVCKDQELKQSEP